MGKIFINNLTVFTIIGCEPQERSRRQLLQFDIEIETDFSAAAASDNLADAINYSELEYRIYEFVSGSNFTLLEALAGSVVKLLLEYPAIAGCRVRITKPAAAKIAESIAVELEGTRGRDVR